jgi:hypothetical protein
MATLNGTRVIFTECPKTAPVTSILLACKAAKSSVIVAGLEMAQDGNSSLLNRAGITFRTASFSFSPMHSNGLQLVTMSISCPVVSSMVNSHP